MTLAWPWLAAAALVLAAGAAAWGWHRRRQPVTDDARWVAHTDDLDALPEVRRALRAYAVVRAAGVAALVLAVVSAAALAGRPVDREVTEERLGSRDIVLCLDVSGSMVPFDSAIIETFASLVESFRGERIALSVFNSSSRTVFPLTDDYTLVAEELATAGEALAFDIESFSPDSPGTWQGVEEFLAFVAGTTTEAGSSSLIGDGLASCALLFDERDTERSRSIILATDNDVLGEPIYSLPEAVDVVAARDVDLYGLYGGDALLRGSAQQEEFDRAVAAAGGRTWLAEDPDAVAAVIEDVTASQAVAIGTDPQVRLADRPQPWFGLLLLGLLGLLAVRWRVER